MSDLMSSYWQDRKVLVTGAGGFIASHLVEALVGLDARVKAFVRYNSRGDPGLLQQLSPDIFSRLEIVAGDLRDLTAVKDAMQNVSHPISFHCFRD